jgi:hypothetical protein
MSAKEDLLNALLGDYMPAASYPEPPPEPYPPCPGCGQRRRTITVPAYGVYRTLRVEGCSASCLRATARRAGWKLPLSVDATLDHRFETSPSPHHQETQ